MAVSVTHAFVSGVADGADATQVRPSNWNAEHTVTGAVAAITSTDNAVARYDGTAGALQNSGAILADDGDFTLPGTNVGGTFDGGVFWVQDQSLTVRNPAVIGNYGEYGKLWYNPGDPTQTGSTDWPSAFIVNHRFTGDPVHASGITGIFGIKATGGSGTTNFVGSDIYVSLNSDNAGTSTIITCSNIFATNFSQVVGAVKFVGEQITLQDYANVGLECRSNYTDFIGLDAIITHRGLGTATNVIGVRASPSNGYVSTPDTVGICTNLIGVDVQRDTLGDNITNAWGVRIEDYSGLGATQSYNIKSEGTASINVFEGKVQASTLALSTDVLLERDAAASLAQRNATTAQAFRVYNTYTDANNYERGVLDWTTQSNVLTIGVQAAGTGSDARKIEFVGNSDLQYKLTGSVGVFKVSGASGYIQIYGSWPINWGTGDAITGGQDTGISRVAAGVLGVGTGSAASVAGYIQWGGQKRVTADFDTGNSTTLANITGLSVAVAAGRTYSFVAELYTTSDVAAGVKFAIAGTATATAIIYEAIVHNAGVLVAQTRATALGTSVGAVTAVTVAKCTITGTITVANAGTLTVQMAQNVGNATGSVALRGSSFIVHDMP